MTDTDELTRIDKTHVISWNEEIDKKTGKAFDPLIKPERKGSIVAIEGDRGGREYRSLARPLDLYVAHRNITDRQYYAGKKFYSLKHYSILRERYVRMPFGERTGDFDIESLALAPRDYLAAYDAIKDVKARSMVVQVCLDESKAGKRGGMDLLKVGLDYLIVHFREQDKTIA